MKIYDLLDKKRQGKELTKEEIDFFVQGATTGKWQDYEISSMLMAIAINSMTKQETLQLIYQKLMEYVWTNIPVVE